MPVDTTGAPQVVLILAPVGKDADVAVSVLRTARIVAKSCQSVSELSERLRAGGTSVGALLLTEESLASATEYSSLTAWLEHQEPWSELPIVLLTHPGQPTRVTGSRSRLLSLRGAVTVLERPVRPAALVGALRVALQSREHQYQLRDLLESQRRAALELQNARLGAEAAERAKDQFLANLSHELRTPLNAILGWTYIMKDARKDAALIEQGLEVLQRNTKTLIELVSDLLDTSRIVAGTLTLDFQNVDLKQVVKESVETFRLQAAEKGVALESFVEVPEEASCTVWGDETRLHQILDNLLSNALKFTPNGGSVTVRLSKAQANLVIGVKDTGKGISAAFLPHIFERFSQDQASSRENRGLGLGLAICKHLVELHHGSIIAQSDGLGRGTMIKVELPAIASKYEPVHEPPKERPFTIEEAMSDTRLKSIKVVAVDDNADSRELLKVILERSSAEVAVVSSGQEALAAIKNVQPEVLVCDLAMPEMDGYELLENVRRLEPELGQLPVIAFTAAARSEDLARTRRAGFQAHLAKPVDPSKLVTTILQLAREHKSTKGNNIRAS
jgi:signal transduction histidine kinase/ActR/RegA family two-component response regulator